MPSKKELQEEINHLRTHLNTLINDVNALKRNLVDASQYTPLKETQSLNDKIKDLKTRIDKLVTKCNTNSDDATALFKLFADKMGYVIKYEDYIYEGEGRNFLDIPLEENKKEIKQRPILVPVEPQEPPSTITLTGNSVCCTCEEPKKKRKKK